jgi:hypothetical protein
MLIAVGACGPRPDPAVRFIAFGDSSSDGPAEPDYPDVLRERLGEPPEALAVEVSGGETAEAGRDRFRDIMELGLFPNAHTLLYWEGAASVLKRAVQLDPLFTLSPLDPGYPHAQELTRLLDGAESAITDVLTMARDAGMSVYVATYFPPPDFSTLCRALPTIIYLPQQGRVAAGYVELLNERIRRAAQAAGATVVDVASLRDEFRANPRYYYDCNHLSAAGNTRVAELFEQIITSNQP